MMMGANSNSQIDMNNNGGQVLAVVHSSALQVETLATSLAIGDLQEQIKPEDQCEETADTQQVDSDDDMDKDERRTNIRRLSPLKWEPDQSSSTLQQRMQRNSLIG